ncbi:MAG: glycoside hydrolase family 97 C-terminal domain-containing protein, partial [Bacteroidaceae bacterium]|nr:glycoside hydrolase family 97 C-terminal domain-containing protein [Bacteroidaceae bacterium]
EVTIYADAPDADYATNPQAYVISKREVTSADILSLDMARGGGFAISFE